MIIRPTRKGFRAWLMLSALDAVPAGAVPHPGAAANPSERGDAG
jgi:hypothetical protein